ncbi:unnamed protein product [Durusdinium trenchii]|uniref:Uncharacterized protein n=1 Tax=Durusdinium trenchii TaxID=1381693 RepID=A0ABP0R8F2_9DINO
MKRLFATLLLTASAIRDTETGFRAMVEANSSATSAATRTPIRSLERTAIQTFDDEDEKFIRMLINMCWGGEEKLSSCIRNGCNKKWKASEYQVIVIHSGHTDISTTIRDEDEMVSFELFPKDGNTIDIHIFCKV